MKKYTLIKFYKGEATEEDINHIMDWVHKSPLNREYFAREKAIYTATLLGSVPIPDSGEQAGSPVRPFRSRTLLHLKKGVISRTKLTYIASVAAISLLFFTTGYLLGPGAGHPAQILPEKATAAAQNNPIIRTLYTEKGVKGFLVLPDSSKVWLNSDSRLSYPDEFTGKTRKITLEGEAYFEVKKDTLHPMIVQTKKDFAIEVKGTSFNIKCYDNDLLAEATLYSGAITMHYKNRQTQKAEQLELKPNESFSYITAVNTPRQFNYKKPENQKAWKEGDLIFDNTPIADVFKILERWHGTSFIIHNNQVYNYKLSAEFDSESIIQIMEIIQMIIPIEYTYKNNIVTVDSTHKRISPSRPVLHRRI